MDIVTIVAVIAALAVVAGLAWAGGFNLGVSEGINMERDLADRRVNGLLAQLNKTKPRTTTRKRRATK